MRWSDESGEGERGPIPTDEQPASEPEASEDEKLIEEFQVPGFGGDTEKKIQRLLLLARRAVAADLITERLERDIQSQANHIGALQEKLSAMRLRAEAAEADN